MRSTILTLLILLCISPSNAAQTQHPAGPAHLGEGITVSPAEAIERGYIYYRDRWLPEKLSRKLARWEHQDAKVKAWSDAYKTRSKHYRLLTNAPHYVTELELKPFLDELYRTYVAVFREDYGLQSKAANKNEIHIYWGYECWRMHEGRDRGTPGYYEPGGALKVMYDPTDTDDFYNTVFHEGAHQFFFATLPGATLPVWLDEALAVYFEGCTFSRSTAKITRNHLPVERCLTAKELIQNAQKNGVAPTPDRLFMAISDPDAFEAEHYALAWSFLYYMLHRHDDRHRSEFCRFLRAMNGAGIKPAADVFREVTRKDFQSLTAGWADFVLSIEAPIQPLWQVLTPKEASPDEDVREGDLLVSIDGQPVDSHADYQRLWQIRPTDGPREVRLLRRYDEKGPMDYAQKYVTVVVQPSSKLDLNPTHEIPRVRNLFP